VLTRFDRLYAAFVLTKFFQKARGLETACLCHGKVGVLPHHICFGFKPTAKNDCTTKLQSLEVRLAL
jgi:hypothetical protein